MDSWMIVDVKIYKSLELNIMQLWTINYDDKVYWNLSQFWKILTRRICLSLHYQDQLFPANSTVNW